MMVRVCRFAAPVAFFSLVSCANLPSGDRPLDVGILAPQTSLDKVTSQLHMRIFPRGMLTCDETSGHIMQNGFRVTDAFAGKNVAAHERCDATQWAALKDIKGGETTPVDVCFDKSGAGMRSLEVPAGNYLVLVEGSGVFTNPDNTTLTATIASGCTTVNAMSGVTSSLTVRLVEQGPGDIRQCGNGRVDLNEQCDDVTETARCSADCTFPERLVSTTTTARRRNPSIAWAPGQPAVVTFDTVGDGMDDVWFHQFDVNGEPITQPAALANDLVLDNTRTQTQQNARVALVPGGWAAAWESYERIDTFDIYGSVVSGFDIPTPQSLADVRVNQTSSADNSALPMQPGRVNPTLGSFGSNTLVWIFEDQFSGTLRAATSMIASPVATPQEDAAVFATAVPGSTNATTPRLTNLGNGLALSWASGPANSRDVFIVTVDDTGVANGAPTAVNTLTSGNQDQPAIAARGNVVAVAWRDTNGTDPQDLNSATVKLRLFNPQLAPITPEILVPTTVAGDQQAPSVAVSASGKVIVVWEDANTGSIRGRLFGPDGAPIVNRVTSSTSDFEVNAAGAQSNVGMGPRKNPSVAFGGMTGNGKYGVVWEDSVTSQTGRIRFRLLFAD